MSDTPDDYASTKRHAKKCTDARGHSWSTWSKPLPKWRWIMDEFNKLYSHWRELEPDRHANGPNVIMPNGEFADIRLAGQDSYSGMMDIIKPTYD